MGVKLFIADVKLRMNGFNVDFIIDGLGKRIESRIKPLVVAVRSQGYETSASCGGHSLSKLEKRFSLKVCKGEAKIVYRAERGLTYRFNDKSGVREITFNGCPWVDLNSNERKIERLWELIQDHNQNGIYWSMTKSDEGSSYRLETVPRYSLGKMRKDSKILADKILRSNEL